MKTVMTAARVLADATNATYNHISIGPMFGDTISVRDEILPGATDDLQGAPFRLLRINGHHDGLRPGTRFVSGMASTLIACEIVSCSYERDPQDMFFGTCFMIGNLSIPEKWMVALDEDQIAQLRVRHNSPLVSRPVTPFWSRVWMAKPA